MPRWSVVGKNLPGPAAGAGQPQGPPPAPLPQAQPERRSNARGVPKAVDVEVLDCEEEDEDALKLRGKHALEKEVLDSDEEEQLKVLAKQPAWRLPRQVKAVKAYTPEEDRCPARWAEAKMEDSGEDQSSYDDDDREEGKEGASLGDDEREDAEEGEAEKAGRRRRPSEGVAVEQGEDPELEEAIRVELERFEQAVSGKQGGRGSEEHLEEHLDEGWGAQEVDAEHVEDACQMHKGRHAPRRLWRCFQGYDVDMGSDAEARVCVNRDDMEACRKHCELNGYGGFVEFNGRAFFRADTGERLIQRLVRERSSVVHIGLVQQAPPVDRTAEEGLAPLQRQRRAEDEEEGSCFVDQDSGPVVDRSWGLWLGPSDFVLADESGQHRGLDSPSDVGVHGFPRDWPRVYSESQVLKNLLKKTGPCAAKALRKVPSPPAKLRYLSQDVELSPTQSFLNARNIAAMTGLSVVRGWAIFDVWNASPGEAYMAQRYWWNATWQGEWLDFTPHPSNSPAVLLVEATEGQARTKELFTEVHVALSDSLACLREHGACAALRLSAETLPLRAAEVKGGEGLRKQMVASGICGALRSQLANSHNAFPTVLLLAILIRFLQSPSMEHSVSDVLVVSGVMEAVLPLLEATNAEVAGVAAVALAFAFRRSPTVQQRLLTLDTLQAAIRLFQRLDAKAGKCRVVEVAQIMWEQLPPLLPGPLDDHGSGHASGRPDADSHIWGTLKRACEELEDQHSKMLPRERRARSWARTLAFARVTLGARGGTAQIRCGTAAQPFIVWVLGAQDGVEAQLAVDGYFEDSNFVDHAPTEIVIFGDNLRKYSSGGVPARDRPPVIRTLSYEALPWVHRLGLQRPDLAIIFMPEVPEAPGLLSPMPPLPAFVLDAVEQVPVVITTRFEISETGRMSLRCKLRQQILLQPTRCPFSSSAGSPSAAVDDNGWLLAVVGPGALAKALQTMEPPTLLLPPREGQPAQARLPALFWGILDIKYDTALPVLERVKVLETGDGRTSKFSGDGAGILRRYKEKYQTEHDTELPMYQVISADKKLTHDLFRASGYGHIVPKQAHFLRKHRPDLAKMIVEALNLQPRDRVVLKLCNRSRAAGVIVTSVADLDRQLRVLLQPAGMEDPESWHKDRIAALDTSSGTDFGFPPGSLHEHARHWWSNESPIFIAERCCKSIATVLDGRSFDGTLRVGFALRRRQQRQLRQVGSDVGGREPQGTEETEMEIDWLGGYWKLPQHDTSSTSLRECVVSAARTSGTAPVRLSHLLEVYAALGDAVQLLFGSPEPSSQELAERHKATPELGAYLTARIGTSAFTRTPTRTKDMLDEAERMLEHLRRTPSKDYVLSFIRRARGVMEARQSGPGQWQKAKGFFEQSLQLSPLNANSEYLLGMAELLDGSAEQAVLRLRRSLLLDPDFKAGYINLAAGHLRLGQWRCALNVSEAGLRRHPDAPQPHYHIAVACAQLALELRRRPSEDVETQGATLASGLAAIADVVPAELAGDFEELRQKAVKALAKARASDEGRRRKQKDECPWLDFDDLLLKAMEGDQVPDALVTPANVGWTWVNFRM